MPEKAQPTGSLLYENWKAYMSGKYATAVFEYPLYSDASWSIEVASGLGPYQIFSSRREIRELVQCPAGIFRLKYFGGVGRDGPAKSVPAGYHGGSLVDEIAALIALIAGIRVAAADSYSRISGPDDPYGRAVYTQEPLIVPKFKLRNSPLPGLEVLREPFDGGLLATLPHLSPDASLTLTVAARQYQQALWYADVEANYAWLALVSAVETVASFWRAEQLSAVDRLTFSRPKLAQILKESGGDSLLESVANEIADYMGATKKFVEFLLEFLPDPPAERPPERYRIDWSKKYFKKAFQQIYGYRSRALHGGTPFPFPMRDSHGAGCERPSYESVMTKDGHSWRAEDCPMVLQTFESIVRRALLTWWRALPRDPQDQVRA